MKLHLVSGFLGSGKTTAIAGAAWLLGSQDKVAGVVTNDQGKYLVDSRFMERSGIPAAEVTGSCFCCNFHLLEKQIERLREAVHPDVIFAESVGSCTDLMATVVKPLQSFHPEDIETITFSGFVDARILLQHLQGHRLPFTEDTNYIWEKQLEEAEILVVNKMDLLDAAELQSLQALTGHAFPRKTILFQNSLDPDSVQHWAAVLGSLVTPFNRKSIPVDYARYGKGEADLAWLDEEMTFVSSSSGAADRAARFIEALVGTINRRNAPIGHLKFFVSNGTGSVKVSYTTTGSSPGKVVLPFTGASRVTVGINARIQIDPETLRQMVRETVDQFRMPGTEEIEEREIAFFRPGFPNPTYRVGSHAAA